MRTIKNNSTFEPYTCVYNWPEDCFVQGGSNGIVLCKNEKNYFTAYFEAFPKEPKCFVRGEGKTIEDAEKDCYEQYVRFSSCKEHTFIRSKGYKNGMGTCTKCGLMQIAFKPQYHCIACNEDNVEAYTSILPKYKTTDSDTICKNCVEKKENFKYLSGLNIHMMCNHRNGILLVKPIMEEKTFELLKEKPKTLEDFLDICSKDNNIYLEESMKRMLMDRDEEEEMFPNLSHKVNNYDELYDYFYENYMDKWVKKGYPNK